MTPSQYTAWLRQQQQRHQDAVRRRIQQIDRVNRANKAAVEKYVRDVNREIERVNRHNQQVVNEHNRLVRQHNQNAQAAVNKYNQVVRQHNAAVESNRQRLRQLISRLESRPNTRYVEVRSSALDLNQQLERVERQARMSSGMTNLFSLLEREAENSAEVANAFVSEEPNVPEGAQDTGILEYLAGFSQDLCDRWKGALFALNPSNPDAGRHFCTSVREIFNEILSRWANDEDVRQANADCELTQQGTPSRRAKIRYLLHKKGADSPEMLGFVDKDIEDILQLFKLFNEATHGEAGRHGFAKLKNIRKRVDEGIMFLATLAL
jgi:hypothetical protein